MRNSGCEVPEWMLSLKAPSQNAKKRLRTKPVNRKDVSQAKGSLVGRKRARGPAAAKSTKVQNDSGTNNLDEASAGDQSGESSED